MIARGYEFYLRVVRRTFPNIFRRFSEDYRRFPRISEEAPMIFRSYSNISKYFFKDYGTIAMVIILVTMVIITTVISSRVKITCYLHV